MPLMIYDQSGRLSLTFSRTWGKIAIKLMTLVHSKEDECPHREGLIFHFLKYLRNEMNE